MMRKTLLAFCAAVTLLAVTPPAFTQEPASLPKVKLRPYHPAPHGITRETIRGLIARTMRARALGQRIAVDPVQIPHWFFDVISSRDGGEYIGVMVGGNALIAGASPSSVPVQIVPVIVNTVTLGTAVDPFTGAITPAPDGPGNGTVFDPTLPDAGCLTAPNDKPVRLFKKSPLFHAANFNFGGTSVGFTQYADAVQRASFWDKINRDTYHVLLNPVTKLAPITLNLPAPAGGTGGLALDLPTLSPGACGRLGIVDVNLIDTFVASLLATVGTLPGVTPGTFPIFMFYNTAFSIGDPTNLLNCCAGGFHNAVNVGTAGSPVFQTYAVVGFDATGAFGVALTDTAIASHEVAEWMNDPLGTNLSPAWGNVGPVQGCQDILEVADPLAGFEAPRIFMPNGFTYHLQEIAFFSWFFGPINGDPSTIGLPGWFSNNGTFLADAGSICAP